MYTGQVYLSIYMSLYLHGKGEGMMNDLGWRDLSRSPRRGVPENQPDRQAQKKPHFKGAKRRDLSRPYRQPQGKARFNHQQRRDLSRSPQPEDERRRSVRVACRPGGSPSQHLSNGSSLPKQAARPYPCPFHRESARCPGQGRAIQWRSAGRA